MVEVYSLRARWRCCKATTVGLTARCATTRAEKSLRVPRRIITRLAFISSPSGAMSAAPSSSVDGPTPHGSAEDIRTKRILSSKLYFDVPLAKVPLIYSQSYDIAFLGIEKLHPFDSSKWGRICKFLISEGYLDKAQIVEPLEATQDDLRVVHPESYLNSLKSSLKVSMIIEVPPVAMLPNCLVQQKVLFPFRKQVGGSILAAKLAKERGWAINVGGGFHHCSSEKGGGFCAVMIIDLDAHQGNGHELDFSIDRRVHVLDMYNAEIYPFDYEAMRYIDQKIELVSGTKTKEYLDQLDKALEVAKSKFDPELVVYNAGTDILDGDPLGRMKISPDGVITRDEKVFRFARDRNIPVLMLTSGGYMKSSARVIADSIANLSKKKLIDLNSPLSRE